MCVSKCAAHACREGGEHDVSHSSIALLQAPSAAPFYFALNGLSKDPLSRAAESFLHFKKKEEEERKKKRKERKKESGRSYSGSIFRV